MPNTNSSTAAVTGSYFQNGACSWARLTRCSRRSSISTAAAIGSRLTGSCLYCANTDITAVIKTGASNRFVFVILILFDAFLYNWGIGKC